jgi:AraC family transcriptional regulator, mar-sox-rob regulon activator
MTTTEKVQEYLRTCDLRRTRQETVAEALGLSNTTMRRRLRAEGVQYYELVEAERLRRCEQLLQDKPMARGKEMMDELGYTELNSFFRAFKRWTGLNFRDKHNPAPVKLCECCGGSGRVVV